MRRDTLCHEVRQRLVRLPPPHQAHYGVVPPPPPEDTVPLGPVLTRSEAANQALARIDTLAADLHDPYLLSRVLTRREAVSSSGIEGTNSTLDELLSVEETEDGEATDAAAQVRDYALALDVLLPRAQAAGPAIFTVDLIRNLHRAVMKGDTAYQDVPGDFRQVVAWIGGGKDIAYSTFNPPPPPHLPACLEQTVDYLRCEGLQRQTQGLLTRMAVAHAHFEAVHPFRDGNGRVGRLLLPLMMAAESHVPLYLSPYIEAHKQAYYDALKAAQQRLEWHAMVGYLADAVVGTVSELLVTRAALADLRRVWLNRRPFRAKSAALRALDILPHYPVITVKRLAKLLNVSFRAADTAIGLLQQAGILTERTGHRRNRLFAATEALSVINRPFGAEPVLPGPGPEDDSGGASETLER
ncbi:Fic family protein [Azospirillum canadense]|uniref:Fic family protein n=1 Tax=Azospirillum canadense TaxID=403962 RepID=UPI002225C07D|nr:Fic/DOC family N-terminal domain-containing protein [Azospirillum canadense]MCW2239169.1 Fic family protein [Azospirillum canadense]